MSQAIQFLRDGFKLAIQPNIRWFVLLPLIINVIFFSFLFIGGYQLLTDWQNSFLSWLPSWLEWLTWLVAPLFFILALLLLVFGFSTVANIIASPFNGLLAEVVEKHLDPNSNIPDTDLAGFLKLIPRALGREVSKLLYYIPRVLGVILLGFIIPGVNVFLWFLLNAWMMNIQYIDYPMDNHLKSFNDVKSFAQTQKALSLSFGGLILILTMIPLVNLIIMPVAVCAATKLWVEQKTLSS